MQFRRLDPLANAGPFQRIQKQPVKSFSLTERQFDWVQANRPQLVVIGGDEAVVGNPYRDFLEVHYGFPEVVMFRDHFGDLFNRVVNASSKEEAPRGVLLSFSDRPNRFTAEPVFWPLALEEGREWVDLTNAALPEQPEPADETEGGFSVRQATDDDRDAVAGIEAEATGLPRLSDGGVTSLYLDSKTLRLVRDAGGTPVALLSLRTDPGGWGIIVGLVIREDLREQLREPLFRWSIAWLRNNGGRRIRRHCYLEDAAEITLLRELGFVAGETGIDYVRPTDKADVKAKIDERQAHGTVIKFGWWR